MVRLTTVQHTFASGEIDPTLRGQNDLKAYANGAKTIRNMVRRSTGGVERRFGTYDMVGMTGRARLAEFEFSDTQRYVLAFRAGFVDVFDLNGTLLTSVAGPWTLTEAFELTYTQLGDVMIIAHVNFMTRVLKRTSSTTFTVSLFAFEVSIDGNRVWQPYFKFAAAAVSVTPSAASGAGITLTASSAVWSAAHVGERIRIYDAEVLITGFTSTTILVGTVQGILKGTLDLDPFKTTSGSTTVEVVHPFHGLSTGAQITLSGSNSVGGIPAANIDGTRVVTVLDDLRYTVVAGAAATSSVDGGGSNVQFNCAGTATRTWLEPSINAIRGYPGACAFHEGRLWLGGTPSQPDGRFGSKANLQIYNFDVGKGYDADSVQVAGGSEDVSRVKHIVSNGDLQNYTATQEAIFITRDGEPITPNNARIKSQSNAGVGFVQPVVFDGATLFVQENGLAVSELAYSSEKGGYSAVPVSTLAGHLIRTPQSSASSPGTTSRAEQFAYYANIDGTLAVFHSLRSENIAGWGMWQLGAGLIQSVCAIGPYVFFCVFVRSAYRLYRYASDDLVSLDGAVVHTTGVATVNWTLDARVRNRTVSIVSELGYHGEVAVPNSGVIVLTVPVLNVVAGDAFFATLETLPIKNELPSGERTGMIRRLVRSIVEFDETMAAIVNGTRLETRYVGIPFESAVVPLSGPYEFRHLGFERSPTTVITQLEPLPMRVLSINQEVKV